MDDREQNATAAFAAQIQPIAEALAAETGQPWTVEPCHGWGAALQCDTGEAEPFALFIWAGFSRDTRNGKAECKIHWPQDARDGRTGAGMDGRRWGVVSYDETEPKAAVSLTRDPRAIARDLVRRVITPGRPLFTAALAEKVKRNGRRDDGHALACELAALLKQPAPEREEGRDYSFNCYGKSGAIEYGTVRVSEHGSYVYLERFSIKPSAAARILAAMVAEVAP